VQTVIGAIDAGTGGVRFVLFDREAREIASYHVPVELRYPQPGWVEQDPSAIISAARHAVNEGVSRAGVELEEIAAIGIANQRETIVGWERETGRPVYPAIVWQDRRTAPRCAALSATPLGDQIVERTGLTIDPYFSATKIAWLLEHIPGLAGRAARGNVLFGTVDAWLLWSLAGAHLTDATNACRTLLYDLRATEYAPELLDAFGVPRASLPEVRPSLSVFGRTRSDLLGGSVSIAGVLGDQQAALLGHAACTPGQAKVTWGTGAFLLAHTGDTPVRSAHRLLSTIAYASAGGGPRYALEGSVFCAGAALTWLRDGLGVLSDADRSDAMARSVSSSEGLCFVPALSGLGAPHWDPAARGALLGITAGTRREHVVRAALEGIAFQTVEVVRAMESDLGAAFPELRVDGGVSQSDFLCQFTSDLLGVPVVRAAVAETTALGAAFAAGWTVGVWDGPMDLRRLARSGRRFEPSLTLPERDALLLRWRDAVGRAKAWRSE
jgi:glycerol kinase